MIDAVLWWVGAIVCGAGALAALTYVLTFPVDLCWRRWGDVASLLKIIAEARRQGRPIFKSRDDISRADQC